MLLFGMDNAATSLARTICPSADAQVEWQLAPPCSIVARKDAHPVAESPGFPPVRRPQCVGLGCYPLTTLRQQLAEEWRGCFYTAEPDLDSESYNYDPMRECFNIDEAVATTDDIEDNDNAATAAAPAQQREQTSGPLGTSDRQTRPRTTRPHSSHNCAS